MKPNGIPGQTSVWEWPYRHCVRFPCRYHVGLYRAVDRENVSALGGQTQAQLQARVM